MRSTLTGVCLCLLTIITLGAPRSWGHPILEVGGKPADRALVTATADPPPALADDLSEAEMALALAGVIGVLDKAQMRALHLAVPLNPGPAGDVQVERRLAVLHLQRGDAGKRVDLVRASDGRLLLRSPGGVAADGSVAASEHVEVREDRLADLARGWGRYRGGYEEQPAEGARRGTVFNLEPPYISGRFILDDGLLRDRLYRGTGFKRHAIDAQARDLAEETIMVRVPASYDPRHPAGLVVWIDPTAHGAPPREFDEALDELGFLCVGVSNAGNNRPVHDRFQLALDAVANVEARYHIDPERVYVTGMSGGGRCASMLWGSFPDVFAGAIPIVGMHSYLTVRVPGSANKIWPKAYAKPRSELLRILRTRRIAPMTGPPDFNHENTMAHVKALDRDGMDVRAFSYEDMSHVMPEPERFAETLRWVDEPRREAIAAAEARAERVMARVIDRFGAGPPERPAHRRLLVQVVESAPWSEAAWTALELLGGASPPD